eukprot:4609966-Amphidinium_carterae.1
MVMSGESWEVSRGRWLLTWRASAIDEPWAELKAFSHPLGVRPGSGGSHLCTSLFEATRQKCMSNEWHSEVQDCQSNEWHSEDWQSKQHVQKAYFVWKVALELDLKVGQ